MDQKFKRPRLWPLLAPQLVILALFLISRSAVLAQIAAYAGNFGFFSYELLSAGGGWVMLSVSVFTASIYSNRNSTAHYEAAITDKFHTIDAKTVWDGLKQDEVMQSYTRWAALLQFLTFAAVAVASVTHWGRVLLSTSQSTVSLPIIFAVVSAGIVVCTFIDGPSSPAGYLRYVLDFRNWNVETTYQWQARLTKEVINEPEVAELLKNAIAALMSDADYQSTYKEYVATHGDLAAQ